AESGRSVPGFEGATMAIVHKEIRFLRRSPYIFFSLAMPVILLLVFSLGGFSGNGPGLSHIRGYAYSVGLAYALLAFTNLVFNVCGADAVGVQLYFLAPVRFRQVLAAKNLAYAVLLVFEAAVLYLVACVIDRPPSALILAATLLGFVMAALCAFTAGNVLSLYFPKKLDLARMGRHAARGTSSMIAIAVEATAIGLAVLCVLAGYALHQPWTGLVLLALLTVLAAIVYRVALVQTDQIALARRETLLAELSKA
ncbi:MAG: hypothetical protein ACRD04_05940, partial [Terriglobales bacterium]